MSRRHVLLVASAAALLAPTAGWSLRAQVTPTPYTVVDAMQDHCYDDRSCGTCPSEGEALYGQDAQYKGAQAAYRDNDDGTVTDLNTGLTWEQAHHAGRLGWYPARRACGDLRLGGQDDWRLPNVKELFSIADFRGRTGSAPFLDDEAFDISPPAAVRDGQPTHHPDMMGQTWSSTLYSGDHWGRSVEAAFFFNFLDGRIKQAPTRGPQGMFYRCVRGEEIGANDFVDNGDGTVTDRATGLEWQQADDGRTRDWPEALASCEDLSLAGHDDWRLPDVKELQSIVDYSRHDPAIDPRYLYQADPTGWFWSGTTHRDNPGSAAYVCFGKCVSVDGEDTHGAGAQRSDPKTGDPEDWPPMGGQRDEVRILNHARCVRGGDVTPVVDGVGETCPAESRRRGGQHSRPSRQDRGQATGGHAPGAGSTQLRPGARRTTLLR